MSELLRAILDANAIDSQPAFYNAQIDNQSTVTASKTFAEFDFYLNCKNDTWFLVTGMAQSSSFTSVVTFGTPAQGECTSVQVLRTSDQLAYENTFELKANLNFKFNEFMTLPNYILFKPNDTILIRQQCQITDTVNAYIHTTNLVLAGIEYKFPD